MYKMYLKDVLGSQISVGLDRKILQELYSRKPRDQLYSFKDLKQQHQASSTPMQRDVGKCAEYQELLRKLICPNPQFLLAVLTTRSSAQKNFQDYLK